MVQSFTLCHPSCRRQVEMERLRVEEEAASAARETEQLGQELAERQAEVQTVQVRQCSESQGGQESLSCQGLARTKRLVRIGRVTSKM